MTDPTSDPSTVRPARRLGPIFWLVVGFAGLAAALWLVRGVFEARQAARNSQSRGRLKALGVASWNYSEALVAGGPFLQETWRAADGTLGHGWATLLLPYLDEGPRAARINFGLPWTDPRNAPHFRSDLPQFLNPGLAERFDARGFGVNHYSANSQVLVSPTPLTPTTVSDGLSHTIFCGEILQNLPAWGAPGNARDPAAGLEGGPQQFGGPWRDRVEFIMLDGQLRTLSRQTSPRILEALASPSGREDPSQ